MIKSIYFKLLKIIQINMTETSNHTVSKSSMFDNVSPKLTFIMGIVVGVAVLSLIGFGLALYASMSGGASFFKGGSDNKVVVNSNPNDQAAPQPKGKVDIALKDSDYIRGDVNAKVTLITYSDLECPYCQRFHPDLLKILNDFPGQVKAVFRHFPLSFHANAQKEAEAAECVGKLGGAEKYWNFIDTIFEKTTSNGTGIALADLPKYAKEVGVNESQFKTCLNNGDMSAKVQTDLQEASQYGVQGTPTTFVNGEVVEGAVPYEQLKAVVEQALAK